MAAAEVTDTAVVLHSSQGCSLGTCPFCCVQLGHDATTAQVDGRCVEITQRTRDDLRECILNYAVQVSAMRKILERLAPGTTLPVAVTFSTLFSSSFVDEYDWWMGRQADPSATSTLPHDMQGNPATSSRAAPGPPAFSSWEFREDWTQIPAMDEYPRWEVQTGKKRHKRWTPYTRDIGEVMESARLKNHTSFKLFIDASQYKVDLVEMTQTNDLTGTVRPVRRLMARSDTDD